MDDKPANAEVHADFVKLFETMSKFAKHMLGTAGEFHPFAAAIRPDGQPELLAGYDGDNERPISTDLTKFIEEALHQALVDGKYRAYGLCLNVVAISEDGVGKTDAVFMPAVSNQRSALHCYLPYQLSKGEVVFGKQFFRSPEDYQSEG